MAAACRVANASLAWRVCKVILKPPQPPERLHSLISHFRLSSCTMDLDNWIEKVKKCESLQEEELKALCEYVGGPSLAPLDSLLPA